MSVLPKDIITIIKKAKQRQQLEATLNKIRENFVNLMLHSQFRKCDIIISK